MAWRWRRASSFLLWDCPDGKVAPWGSVCERRRSGPQSNDGACWKAGRRQRRFNDFLKTFFGGGERAEWLRKLEGFSSPEGICYRSTCIDHVDRQIFGLRMVWWAGWSCATSNSCWISEKKRAHGFVLQSCLPIQRNPFWSLNIFEPLSLASRTDYMLVICYYNRFCHFLPQDVVKSSPQPPRVFCASAPDTRGDHWHSGCWSGGAWRWGTFGEELLHAIHITFFVLL